jgi:hypothetical protein
MKVLLVLGEPVSWSAARYLSYHCQFGLRDALLSAGAEVTTIAGAYVELGPDLLRNRKFDQVWVEAMINPYLSAQVLSWLAGCAPVRIGVCAESLSYTERELESKPEFAYMTARVRPRMRALTHMLAGDETDLAAFATAGLHALWWPVSINKSITPPYRPPGTEFAPRFFGHLYGERADWLQQLRGEVAHQTSPESATRFPLAFDLWQGFHRVWAGYRMPLHRRLLRSYVYGLRTLRQHAARGWLKSMQDCSAVVSLPAAFKSYPGRVTEGMAAGRAVLCAAVPERPLTQRLFEPGREILLFHSVDELGELIQRARSEPHWTRQVGQTGYNSLMAGHTTEQRVKEVLRWVDTGEIPAYSAALSPIASGDTGAKTVPRPPD